MCRYRTIFSLFLTASESREPKPSPVPFIQAMDDLALTSDNTLIIEDSQTGLLSAVGSGAQVIGITTSLSNRIYSKSIIQFMLLYISRYC